MPVGLGRMPRWLSAVAVAYSFCLAGFAWFVGGVQRCFESCMEHSDPGAQSLGWARFTDAWQWSAIVWLGLAALVLAAAMAVLVWRDRRAPSVAAAGAWGIAALALTLLVASASMDTGLGLSFWVAPGAALVGATVAAEWLPAAWR
jgi:hypothetical protein